MTETRQLEESPASLPSLVSLKVATAPPMLSPHNAWRILRRRTGGQISRSTFYRWLTAGKLLSIRVGVQIFIPWPALEELMQRCLKGERV